MEYVKYVTGTAEKNLLRICDNCRKSGESGRKLLEQLMRDDLYLIHFSKAIGEDEYGNSERIVWFHEIAVVYRIDSKNKRINILQLF